MNNNTILKKIVAMALAVVMMLSVVPVTASAADASRKADTIFFATDRHQETSKLQSLLKALAYEPGLVVLGGDHVNNTNSGSLASITSEIQSVYPGVQTYYTYAAHDPNVSADSSNPYAFARTGEVYEGEDYYVYAVDQNDMQSSSNASAASADFVSWAEGIEDGKVIFVMCHMPIHKRRGDNAGGATWMNALNQAGKNHDIVYLWGHNHTGENSTDTSVYFVSRGGSLTPQGGSTGTINFTYMNAGYIKNGYASMVVIDDDAVNITRYNTRGSVTATYSAERLFTGHTHEWQASETVDATCAAEGYVLYSCTGCGETYTESIPATGSHSYETVTVNATCTVEGSVTDTCTVCGDTHTEVIPATGHSYEAAVTAPTCTEAGSVTYTCACGDTYTEAIPALGHEYEAVTVNATCTEAGSVTYTCSCGDTYTEAIPALGHSYEAAVTAPTCEEAGYTTHTCSVCGDSYVTDETAALGHAYETVTVDPTCTQAGYTAHTCTRCDEGTVYDEIPALGHSYESVVTAPDCENTGCTTHTCTVCGDRYVTDETPALGHDYESVVTAPTCEEAGYTTHTCSVCGLVTVDSPVEALGHEYESVTVNATCTEAGSVTYTCSCGDTYTEVIPALGHSYEAVTVNATCTEAGSVTYTCSCGDTYTEVIPALGHSYETVVTAPTCTEAGFTTYTCSCGDTYTADQIAATGHSYTTEEVDGELVYTCGACGHSYAESLEVSCTYDQVSSFASGERFVIVLKSSNSYYALSHAGNTITKEKVTVSNGQITSEITDDLLWTYQNSKLCYEDGDTTYYLYASSNSGWGGWWGSWWGSGSLSVSASNSSTVSYSGSRVKVGSYYLRYSSSTIKADRSASTAYLFQQNAE